MPSWSFFSLLTNLRITVPSLENIMDSSNLPLMEFSDY